MKAYHGTGVKFDKFEDSKILSGEGLAKRGWGFNFSLDRGVAEHFADCAAGYEKYVIEAVIPNPEELFFLEESLESCLPASVNFDDFLDQYYEIGAGVTPDDIFDDAAEQEDISMSVPDHLAQEAFRRILLNMNDDEAADLLREWSPSYDWDRVLAHPSMYDPGLVKDENNGADLLEAITNTMGGPDHAARFLAAQGIYGTIGSDPISEHYLGPSESTATRDNVQKCLDSGEPGSYSVVVFRAEDITIKSVHHLEPSQRPENEDDLGMSL